MSEWLLFNTNSAIFQLYHQQSAGRHIAPLGHIILIPSQPVFALTPYCCVLNEEAKNTNFIVFGLSQPRLEPTIYRTRCEHANQHTTDAVPQNETFWDTKELIRNRKSNKERQCNDWKKKDKSTNNGLRHTTQKPNDWATQIPLKTRWWTRVLRRN